MSRLPNVHLPKVGSHLELSLPSEHVFQLVLNRPAQLNTMTDALEADLCLALAFFDSHPALRVAIIAGRGKAFCAGQDLKDWLKQQGEQPSPQSHVSKTSDGLPLEPLASVAHKIDKLKAGGFGGLSSRRSVKPIIAAVDGICMGGGTEIILNCDLVVASTRSVFALPEAARGVIASQGGIARLARICGHQRAAEMLLLCEPISAEQAYHSFHFINRLLPLPPPSPKPASSSSTSSSATDATTSMSWEAGEAAILRLALVLARKIASHSPDAVQLTKAGLVAARGSAPPLALGPNDPLAEDGTEKLSCHVDEFQEDDVDLLAVKLYRSRRSRALYAGENIQEGLKAFKEKRQPAWKDVALIDDGSTPPGWERAKGTPDSKL
ncbi:unnamed protein product [Tilletia controversa]|uniref:3-hydroxyisobutyryl-CoA hydrolase n=3 Tax=Tilletia TaxID=13289 RepID=A0A8X7MRI2_9BASI|nr:hypothetical protein CF336_g5256 [Tilletia laevis]KAE8194285.1 hypothetical protein CF328_g4794 [Tilletia controversa]KAE8257911.1 hypothetical protein A4X03_0g4531 [Tilletia caries]KAE8197687.1 hypothetical protein CF335_g4553 [Tilletia laevis]KAE8245584.1 hypothetical protein A4X06_0g5571 [Tilletia controversa]